jgi:hypothetical protein
MMVCLSPIQVRDERYTNVDRLCEDEDEVLRHLVCDGVLRLG